MPAKLSFIEAASVPMAATTAWRGLFEHGNLKKNQTVLIHGAAGAVGAYAVQFTQGVIITQLESLLNFSDRFYNRQFIMRKVANHKILNQFEEILTEYLSADTLQEKGLPTVKFIAETLNTSTNYLSGVLKTVTGKNTQQYIHKSKRKIINHRLLH